MTIAKWILRIAVNLICCYAAAFGPRIYLFFVLALLMVEIEGQNYITREIIALLKMITAGSKEGSEA